MEHFISVRHFLAEYTLSVALCISQHICRLVYQPTYLATASSYQYKYGYI